MVAAGAILKWAVNAHVKWIDLQTAGTVLFVIGLAGLVVALLYTFLWSPRARRDEATRVVPPPPDRRI